MTVDSLIQFLRSRFSEIKDHRSVNRTFSLKDNLMAGFSMFHQKDASLLAFREQFPARSKNMKNVYGFEKIPSDTAFRECLDGVNPDFLQNCFSALLSTVLATPAFMKKRVLGNRLTVSFDGTSYFSSSEISCPCCLTKEHKNGVTTYHHQMLGAVIVAYNQPTVLPVFAEAIVNGDGSKKNDCEHNAFKRLVPKVREMMGNHAIVAVLDALYTDGPTIKALLEQKMDYIIGIKDGYVLIQVEQLTKQNKHQQMTITDKNKITTLSWVEDDLILNGANQDIKVKYFSCIETEKATNKIIFKHAWITNLDVCTETVYEMVKVARSRWKIENETFNTLKNQGYHFEHNFGHGKKYLSTTLALLMFLAFATDQIAQALDELFLKAMATYKTKVAFFKRIAALFDVVPVKSMSDIYKIITGEYKIQISFIT